jgi:hypothetical protein
MLELLNKYKQILYIVTGVIVIYLLVYLFTPKPSIPIEYKATIDSLTKVNAILVDRQNQIDSLLSTYNIKIDSIDNRIDNVKEKTIIIKKYYHEVSKKIDTFHTVQLDSFFKTRYKY